jgi:hypothetical protein
MDLYPDVQIAMGHMDSWTQPIGFDRQIRWLSRALKQNCVAHGCGGDIGVILALSAVV